MKFHFIAHHAQDYPIMRLCQVLGVDESSYYNWRKRLPSSQQLQDATLAEEIRDAYERNHQVYGSPRIQAELRERGLNCGRKRIASLMREHGLCAKAKARRVRTTDSRHSDPIAPNLLQQKFTADEPDRKWVADITAVWTSEG